MARPLGTTGSPGSTRPLGTALLAAALLAACSATVTAPEVTVGPLAGAPAAPAAANTVAVGQLPGTFGLAVTARGWTYDATYTPDVSAGALRVGLAVAGYGRGTGEVTITDAAGAVVFARSLAGNATAAEAQTSVRGRAPFRVRVAARDYTGAVSLGVLAGG